jgi:protein O-mannosyl-transferase
MTSAVALGRRRAARRIAWMSVATGAFGFAVFARALTFGFAYDDAWTIVKNARLAGPLHPVLRAIVGGTATKLGLPDATRPVMVTSMWIDRHLFGLEPFGYHLHSLLLYALVCALATLLLLALTRSFRSALGGGLFFAAAPLHAEVVAAANYREDLLASLGVLTALLLLWWPFPVTSPLRKEKAASPLAVALVVVSFAVALLSKESAVALVLMAAVIAALRRPDRSWLSRHEGSIVALLAVAVAWANWRFGLPPGGDDVPRDTPAPLATVMFATARFELLAVAEALFPFGWSPEHATSPAASAWWLVGWCGLVAAMAWLARRRVARLPVLGVAMALAAALPSSPLAGPANRHADRYFFLAIFGGALVWGVVMARAGRRIHRAALVRRAGERAMTSAYQWLPLLGVLPLVFVAQNAVAPWKDDAALWSSAVERAPDSPRAWAALSRVRRLRGDLDSADEAVDRALSLEPTYAPARLTRVYNRLARGEVDSARAEIEALRVAASGLDGLQTAVDCAEGAPADARACIIAASLDPR